MLSSGDMGCREGLASGGVLGEGQQLPLYVE